MILFDIAYDVDRLPVKCIDHCRTELTFGAKLKAVEIERTNIEEDWLSPTIAVHWMTILTLIRMREKVEYVLKSQHLLFTDGIKIHCKDESRDNSHDTILYTFSADNRIEFGLDTCSVLDMKRGKIKCMIEIKYR